jgi:hypothetical protein
MVLTPWANIKEYTAVPNTWPCSGQCLQEVSSTLQPCFLAMFSKHDNLFGNISPTFEFQKFQSHKMKETEKNKKVNIADTWLSRCSSEVDYYSLSIKLTYHGMSLMLGSFL